MKKRLLAGLVCLVLVLAPAACSGKSASGGEGTFTLEVVHGDGERVEIAVDTQKETLGEALLERELIAGEDGPYGLYVQTVDEETVDPAKEQWWCITKDGQSVNTGVDSTPIEAGATYTFTFTEGY